MTAFTAPAVDLRNGVDYVTASTLQDAMDALEWRDGPSSVRQGAAACNSTTVLTTTATDVPGATMTFTVVGPAAVVVVNGSFAFPITATGATVAIGWLMVDGVLQSGQALKDGSAFDSHNSQQVWMPTLAAGSHTLKLQVSKTAALGTISVEQVNTVISVLLIDHR